jgi:predicted DNA-binding transcriptional regulator AlpA
VTLAELVASYRRRAVEAATVGATAPVAAIYEAVLADLAPLCPNGNRQAKGPPPAPVRQLTAKEAAALLGVSVRWLYRHAKTLPFAKRLADKTLRFDAAGLAQWPGRR